MNDASISTESNARDEICRVGKSLFDRGYVHGTAGNISVRLDESIGGGYLITPTDACLGFLDAARLSRLDAAGKHISGDVPSKTMTLHTRIYDATSSMASTARCVIHTHSTHCVALTLPTGGSKPETVDFRELLPPITPYFVMKVGRVPVIPYAYPGSAQTADEVQRAIALYVKNGWMIRAVMLERLGPNVWHQSPAQAMATLEELEETAKLYCLSHGAVEPLNPQDVEELRRRFNLSTSPKLS